MSELDTETNSEHTVSASSAETQQDYEEFEIGHHKVPWFLWVFFTLIVTWASVSWIKFWGY